MDWLKRNAGTLSKVLDGVGTIASLPGVRGLPGAGMVADVCGIANKLIGLGGGGGGGGGGGVAPSMDLSSIESGIASVENSTNEMKASLQEQGEDIKEIKTILQDGLTEISNNMGSMKNQINQIQSTAMKSFEMIKEMAYLDGIENIKSAHNVFFSKSRLDLDKRIQQFDNHRFELSKQYDHHMNPHKIGRFLNLLLEESKEDGQYSALSMYHYVMTVEAMYLQMMSVIHIYDENLDGLVDQLENYTAHSKELTRIMSSALKLDEHVEEFNQDGFLYKELTGFVAAQLSQKAKIEDMVMFISKESMNKPIFSRTDKAGCVLYHIPLLWLASEAGSLEKVEILLKLGADINMTAFDSLGVPISCLEIAARMGHLDVVNFIIEKGAQVNNGLNCLLDPCKQGKEGIVRALLDAGEDPNRPGKDGKTSLFVARREGHEGICALLEQHGADTHIAHVLKKKQETKDIEKDVKMKAKKTEQDDGGKKTIRVRSMTSELKTILNKIKALGNFDDSYHNACQGVFQVGGEVVCDYNPEGNSPSNPMLHLNLGGRSTMSYPFQSSGNTTTTQYYYR